MPADLLMELFCDFYDDKEIDAVKECLFSLLPVSESAQRKVRRKGANKKSESDDSGSEYDPNEEFAKCSPDSGESESVSDSQSSDQN